MDPILTQWQETGALDWDALVNAWSERFPLLQKLQETPQEPEWHGEGDVHIHTGMVVEETLALLRHEAAHLSPPRQLALVLGAIFHDIAKPLTTRTREVRGHERIVAPRHAERGRSYLAYRLFSLNLPYPVLQQALALVGHHHDPLRLLRRDHPPRDYRRLARLVDLELVYWLEIADMRGRVCRDQQDQLDQIELFRMFAEEYGVWGVGDPYQSWRATLAHQLVDAPAAWRTYIEAKAIREAESGAIATPEEAIARAYNVRDGYGHLVLLCGPSGAGKSSWIQQHLPDHHPISMDALRQQLTGKVSDQSVNGKVRHLAVDQLKEHLRRRDKVVWDATNLRKDFRRPLIDLGLRYHAFVTLVVFHASEGAFALRNAQRQQAVPASVLRKQLQSLEWPTLDEAHRVIFVDEDGAILADRDTLLPWE